VTWTIVVAVVCTVLVAFAGGALTKLDEWYYALRFPSWKPPDWAFGPAWSVILGSACYGAVLGWDNAPSPHERTVIVILFAANGVLNAFWSFLHFTCRRPDWAMLEVGLLQSTNIALCWYLYDISHVASYCMVPYVVWVVYAGALNAAVVLMNWPFGRKATPIS
jgi:tryptophan-rich sensory protein